MIAKMVCTAVMLLLMMMESAVFAAQISSWSTGGGIVSAVTFPASDTTCSTTPTGATIMPLGVCQVSCIE